MKFKVPHSLTLDFFPKLCLHPHIPSIIPCSLLPIYISSPLEYTLGFPAGSEVKASACNAGDPGSIPGSGRSSGEGNGNPLQYSCLENPMDRGAWYPIVHGVPKSRTQWSSFTWLDLTIHYSFLTVPFTEMYFSLQSPIEILILQSLTQI